MTVKSFATQSENSVITVRLVDYKSASDAQALVYLLNAYACDAAGGGEPLSDFAQSHLVSELARRPHVFSYIAWDAAHPVGLVNCIEGFSTFACMPLVNVHDLTVISRYRGQGVGRLLLNAVEVHARQLGACKLTLEVLSGNVPARQLYDAFGFADYQLSESMGTACFMQKWLIRT